ncbi:hypothetical protein AWR27_17580 [Spirosoma montaniterrae]|uniref:Glycosyl hydrolase n=1 Tax=Spirosoma montaniterrae TaxID=1178516 RepID=A0A1P9X067_9BACT|nr:hypothetical protein AWR27_17580 [Spirosoma montaniterrae]
MIALSCLALIVPAKAQTRTLQPANRQAFSLSAVRLLPGERQFSRFYEAKQKDAAYLLSLNPDRLMHWPRQAVGLLPKGDHYGGWESGVAILPGHYLSACSMMWATTGNEALRERVNDVVDELALCQQQRQDGGIFVNKDQIEQFELMRRGVFRYQSAGPEFPFVNGGNPWYSVHKLMAGLRDAYHYAGNEKARQTLIRLADWTYDLVLPIADSTFQQSLDVEHAGMTEVLADVYALNRDTKYLTAARKFIHQRVYRPLLEGRDMLYPHHANAQVPKFIGYERLNEVAGDTAAGRSASNFFDIVLRDHTLVIGGNSEYERFGPARQVSRRIGASSAETCNTYNMLKLAHQLYRRTGEVRYMDYYERALYNHILAAIDPETGMFCYYLSTKPGFFKTFSTPHESNWCCVGSGMENPGQYETALYAHTDRDVFVNLYVPSRLTWAERGFQLRQEGRFPESDTMRFTIEQAGKQSFTLSLRNPIWARGRATLLLNGKPVAVDTEADYLSLTRRWRKNDRLTLVLPRQLRIETTPDNPNVAAILYGPLVLAGTLGNLADEGISPFNSNHLGYEHKPELRQLPRFVADKTRPETWIEPMTGPDVRFRARPDANAEPITLLPFYRVNRQRYSIYWDMFSPADWQQYQQSRYTNLLDAVATGDSTDEVRHGLRGADTRRSTTNFRTFRTAGPTGWFSYDLKAGGLAPVFLVCQFWGGTWEGAWGPQPDGLLDIYVNDVKVATKNLGDKRHETLFYDEVILIPDAFRRPDGKLTVRFQPQRGAIASGVFGCRVVMANGLTIQPLLSDQ